MRRFSHARFIAAGLLAAVTLLGAEAPASSLSSVLPEGLSRYSSVEYSEISDLINLTVAEVHDAAVTPVVGPLNASPAGFLYGLRDFPVSIRTIALFALGVDPRLAVQSGLGLSNPIPVKDANGVISHFAVNVLHETGERVTVIIAAHTRTRLVERVSEDVWVDSESLPVRLPSGKLVSSSPTQPETAADSSIVEYLNVVQVAQLVGVAKLELIQSDPLQLHAQEVETEIALNNLAMALGAPAESLESKATYDGQDANGGYGGIVVPSDYLADRYGGSWSLSTLKILSMPNFTMSTIDLLSPSQSHCVLTAITRAFAHARQKGFASITGSNEILFTQVKSVGLQTGYSAANGVAWWMIEGMIEKVGDNQGYPNTDSKWISIFSWDGTVKSSIATAEPLLYSMVSGYYGEHAVTVAGWREYKSSSGKTARLLAVWDGWKSSIRYIDFDAVSLITASTYHTVEVQ